MNRVQVASGLALLLLLAASLAPSQLSAGESFDQAVTSMTGGHYVLSMRVERVGAAPAGQPSALMSGGGYQLMVPAAEPGSGCCCKCYLPIILRK